MYRGLHTPLCVSLKYFNGRVYRLCGKSQFYYSQKGNIKVELLVEKSNGELNFNYNLYNKHLGLTPLNTLHKTFTNFSVHAAGIRLSMSSSTHR